MTRSDVPSFFGISLPQLRTLWRDLVPAGWLPARTRLRPDLPDDDLPALRAQIDECLRAPGGEVSARARAAALGQRYLDLDAQGQTRFLQLLASEFGVDDAAVAGAIARRDGAAGEDEKRCATDELRDALRPAYSRLLTLFNDLPQGVKFIVDLRAHLLRQRDRDADLVALDGELRRLLGLWFDVGFLELRRISWDSPASLLEKLISYEAVHEIESWSDLRNRLDRDRRCYAFFHWRMPDEPLIFIEVALVRDLAGSIQGLLDESASPLDPQQATTAIFYSISNTQKGLQGISFGSFLIKRVVDALLRDFPRLKIFATLSPLPGFMAWAAPQLGDDALLTRKEQDAFDAVCGGRDLATVLADPRWCEDDALAAALQRPVLRLAARYLVEARKAARPLDPVARFHLGNGARIERLNWLGDTSAKGLRQSAGVMVNYAYVLDEIAANHEAHFAGGAIATSPAVRKLLG